MYHIKPTSQELTHLLQLKYSFCDLKNNELCLVGFQMTTGEKKHLKVVGGRRIRTKFQELCNKETLNTSNMYIVFVTAEKNAPSLLKKKHVKWIIENGEESEEFRDVRQFFLVMPDSLGIVPDDCDEKCLMSSISLNI